MPDLAQNLTAQQGLGGGFPLPPGVGLPAQFAQNLYVSNKGFSSYNGLLMTVRKRLSHNLQMNFNYTFSHSIDNFSAIAKKRRLEQPGPCNILKPPPAAAVLNSRAPFHQRDGIYDLPFGRNQAIGRDMSARLDAIVGGWEVAPVVTWRTGFPFSPIMSRMSQTTSLGTDISFGIFNGNAAAISNRNSWPIIGTTARFSCSPIQLLPEPPSESDGPANRSLMFCADPASPMSI